MIRISVTLKEGGQWYDVTLTTLQSLVDIFNTGMLGDDKIYAVQVAITKYYFIYDFVIKRWRNVQ